MAIRTAPFKAGVVPSQRALALSRSGFLAIVSMRETKKRRNRQTEKRKETP
jgi:hypothetical protein